MVSEFKKRVTGVSVSIQLNTFSLWNYPLHTIVQLGMQKLTLLPHLTWRILTGAEVKGPTQKKRSKRIQMTLIFGISLLEMN